MAGRVIKYPIIFFVTLAILFFIIVSSEYIGNSSMKEKMEESADILCERADYYDAVEGIPVSKIDRYADSVLLSIAYNTSSISPVSNAMWSSYYKDEEYRQNFAFGKMLKNGYEANMQYLRYWHGAVVFARIFHLFTNIGGMYIFFGTAMFISFASLLFILWKNRFKLEAVLLIISACSVGIWFVPFSLEYIWTFLIAFVVSIIAVLYVIKGKWNRMGTLFLISGMITNYLDFLTTETLTLLIPLLLILSIGKSRWDEKGSKEKQMAVFAVKKSLLWGLGYIGMWISKWIIASLVIGENAMPYVNEHIGERIGSGGTDIINAVLYNVNCIFGLGNEKAGYIVMLIVFMVMISFCIAYKKKKLNNKKYLVYICIGLIPILRYAVLSNHSVLHFYFTYRAQMAGIFALSLAVYEIVDWRFLDYVKKRKA